MDIVIPLGNGTRWQNNELRFCLRSIEKHLRGFDRIFLIGEKPDWLRYGESKRTIIHIPFPDSGLPTARNENIFRKLCAAARDERITENFIHFDDDYFLTVSLDENIPVYHKGLLKESIAALRKAGKSPYINVLTNTAIALRGYNEVKNFDVHYPAVFNKNELLELKSLYSTWPAHGYAIRTLYRTVYHKQSEQICDTKFVSALSKAEIQLALSSKNIFSLSNKSLNADMKEVLLELYPQPSIYEK